MTGLTRFAAILGPGSLRVLVARGGQDQAIIMTEHTAGGQPLPSARTTLAPHPGRFDSKAVERWWRQRTAPAYQEFLADLERAVPMDVAARACCCPARPVVTVVMLPTASRPHPVDLLLCGHHFRVSQAALQAVGAAVCDETGLLIMAGTGDAGVPGPKADRLVGTAPGYQA